MGAGASMAFPGVEKFLGVYHSRAEQAGVDPLGHYMAPLAYAQMQVVARAIIETGGPDDTALSAFTKETTFETVMGLIKFGRNGEWDQPRVVQVQYQGIESYDAEQFLDGSMQIVVAPHDLSSGKLIYPYADALSVLASRDA
jgi:branched-chain amino acid transport system substrate-binding protein